MDADRNAAKAPLYSSLTGLNKTCTANMFRSRFSQSGSQGSAADILYSNLNAKYMLIGTVCIAVLFIVFSIIVFTVSTVRTSMYVLIVGILIVVLIVIGAKLLSLRWRVFSDDLEEVLHTTSGSTEEPSCQAKETDTPPTYYELYKEEEPPTYDMATNETEK